MATTNQLKQQWQGTDDEARKETYGGGASHYFATPYPKSEMGFAIVLGLASVISVPLLWSNNAGASLGLGVVGLALAAYAAAGSMWTFRHPDRAAQHMAAAREYNQVRWRKHPLSVAGAVIVVGFFNGFIRYDDHGTSGRFIAGLAGAAVGLVVSGIAVWYYRRSSKRGQS